MADPRDRNLRRAGMTRANAAFERYSILNDRPLSDRADSEESSFDDTLVLLLRSPHEPTSSELQQAAESAFCNGGIDSVHEREGWEFNVRWADRSFPFHPDQCLIPRSAMHGVTIAVHAGWLAVDIVAAPPEANETERLNAVGRLLAELIDGGAVAVYRPATAENLELSPGIAEMLKAGRIGEALMHVDGDPA